MFHQLLKAGMQEKKLHVAFVINDMSFNVFAANSEAVTGQQWNIPSSQLVSVIWTSQGCWRDHSFIELCPYFPASPSDPPVALKLCQSLSDISRSQWWAVSSVTPRLLHSISRFFFFLLAKQRNVTLWRHAEVWTGNTSVKKSLLWNFHGWYREKEKKIHCEKKRW